MRALLSGYYGKGNGGDEALLATLLQLEFRLNHEKRPSTAELIRDLPKI